jgi:hypothetical protein
VDFGSDVIKLDAIEVSNYYICAFFLRNEWEKKKKGEIDLISKRIRRVLYIYIYELALDDHYCAMPFDCVVKVITEMGRRHA